MAIGDGSRRRLTAAERRGAAADMITLASTHVLVEAGFRRFMSKFPSDVDRDMVVLLQQAFFAGAGHLFYSVTAATRGDVPEAVGRDFMDRIDRELRQFTERWRAIMLADLASPPDRVS